MKHKSIQRTVHPPDRFSEDKINLWRWEIRKQLEELRKINGNQYSKN